MSAPTKQPVNALDRSTQRSATQSIVQPKETSVLQAQALSAEVPVGVLELPVTVWGSRRIASDSGQPGRIEVLAEETCTVIVFPHGAVIRLSSAVEPGQVMMVANCKSHQNVPCRVVNVKKYPNARGYAEIEFLQPANGFWGAYIPQGTLKLTDGARIPAATSGKSPRPSPVATNSASSQAWIPTRCATSSKLPAAASTPPEDFLSSSFPKEVISVVTNAATTSPAAAHNVQYKMESVESRAIQIPSVGKPVQRAAIAATACESRSETTEPNDSKPNPLLSPGIANSSNLAVPSTQEHQWDESASERSVRAWIRGLLGSLLGHVITRTAADRTPSSRRRMVFVWVTLTGLFITGATGIFLLHHGTAESAATNQTNPTPVASTDSPIAPTMHSLKPERNSTSRMTGPRIAVKTEGFPGSRSRELADNVRIFQPLTRKPTSVGKIPNGKLLAPHSMERRSDAAIGRDAAPDVAAVDPNSSASAIQGVLAALSPVGGRMKEAQLVTRTVPSYPALARRVGIEGDVTIDAVIDTDGKLTNLKVVSGAPLLQQAALDSLRNWKYEPGYLDDKPVAVKTSVIVKFRLR
jgi:TonB family protein